MLKRQYYFWLCYAIRGLRLCRYCGLFILQGKYSGIDVCQDSCRVKYFNLAFLLIKIVFAMFKCQKNDGLKCRK